MWIRVSVALLILLPLSPWYLGKAWYFTFGVALVGFGAGHLVEYWVKGRGRAAPGGAAPKPWSRGRKIALVVVVAVVAIAATAVTVSYRMRQAEAVDRLLESRRGEAGPMEARAHAARVIRVLGNGRFELDGQEVSPDELTRRLKPLPADTRIELVVRDDLPHRAIVEVVDLIRQAGKSQISLKDF